MVGTNAEKEPKIRDHFRWGGAAVSVEVFYNAELRDNLTFTNIGSKELGACEQLGERPVANCDVKKKCVKAKVRILPKVWKGPKGQLVGPLESLFTLICWNLEDTVEICWKHWTHLNIEGVVEVLGYEKLDVPGRTCGFNL